MKSSWTSRMRTLAVALAMGGSVVLGGLGIGSISHSPLFLLRNVELEDVPADAPIGADSLLKLAAVPVGRANLFDLELASIEKRVLSNDWVREVRLVKRFPQTLEIAVLFRQPLAYFQRRRGEIGFVDADGVVFGRAGAAVRPDLPIITGFDEDTELDGIREALAALRKWDASQASRVSQLSSLSFEPEAGFRAIVSYPLLGSSGGARGRARVDLGRAFLTAEEGQLERLSRVLTYLGGRGISVRQIWADAGKKIIVKLAARSKG